MTTAGSRAAATTATARRLLIQSQLYSGQTRQGNSVQCRRTAAAIAQRLAIQHVTAECLPQDKAAKIQVHRVSQPVNVLACNRDSDRKLVQACER